MQDERTPADKASYTVAFEEIERTADQALRIFGDNMKELLLNAAKGMNSLMVSNSTLLMSRKKDR